jgi:prepilin-type processing-associated H-X9-DG protein
MTRRAITTIEALLCVVVMVAVTSALTPIQAGDPPKKKDGCISNLKQSGLAIIMYGGDYDDVMPPARKWMDTIHEYVKAEAIFHCPALGGKAYGYAFHSDLAGKDTTKIKSPERAPLVFDSSQEHRSAVATLKSLPSPPRHEGKNNICYADGHTVAVAGH